MSSPLRFTHLHVASAYSCLESTLTPDAIAERAAADGATHAALTDRGTLAGLPAFERACEARGIKPIPGLDAKLVGGGRLVLLAKSDAGVKTLYRHISRAEHDRARGADSHQGDSGEPEFKLERLLRDSTGIQYLVSGDESILASAARKNPGRAGEAIRSCLSQMATAVPGAVSVGVTRRTGRDRMTAEEREFEHHVVEGARKNGLPIIAATGARIGAPSEQAVLRVLTAVKERTHVGQVVVPEVASLLSAGELREVFADHPEWLTAAGELASHLGARLPRINQMPAALSSMKSGESAKGVARYLAHLAASGVTERLGSFPDEYRERLGREIRVLRDAGFADYMLLVGEQVRSAKEQGVPVGPGRGSAAGSLTAWALGITDVDPVEYGLSFERFLNPSRLKRPDIDIDIAASRRDSLLDSVAEDFGRDRVAKVVVNQVFRFRSALDRAGTAAGLTLAERNELKQIAVKAGAGAKPLADVIATTENHDRPDGVSGTTPAQNEVLAAAAIMEGLPSGATIHQSALIMAPKRLSECAPLSFQRGADGVIWPVVQFGFEDAERLGLLKIDYLSMPTLDTREEVLASVESRTGKRPDIDSLDLEDPAVYTMLSHGYVTGVFQLEGEATRRLTTRMRPRSFSDLVALNALTRPGASHLASDYVARASGKAPAQPPHPDLEEITRKTHGLLIYQEQVNATISKMGGYSAGEADLMRRALDTDDQKEKDRLLDEFDDKAVACGYKDGQGRQILSDVAGYGFCEAHAVAYAKLVYQSAWLKRHYPNDFHAVLLRNSVRGTAETRKLLGEARACGAAIVGPSLLESDLAWQAQQMPGSSGVLRAGLAQIKDVSGNDAKQLIERRHSLGRDITLRDLDALVADKTLASKTLRPLAASGALDGITASRASALAWAEAHNVKKAGNIVERARQLAGIHSTGHDVQNRLSPEAIAQAEEEALGFPLTQRSHGPEPRSTRRRAPQRARRTPGG